jgi:hypothetical protein
MFVVAHVLLKWMKKRFGTGRFVYGGCRDSPDTGELLAEWAQNHQLLVEGDFSKYDSYQRGLLITTEMECRRLFMPAVWRDPTFAAAMALQKRGLVSYVRGLFRMKSTLKRQSGDYFTSFSNSLNNLLFSCYAFLKAVSLQNGLDAFMDMDAIIDRYDFRLIFNGDDHIIHLNDGSLVGDMEEVMLKLGLPVKYKAPKRSLQQVMFLGGRPVRARVDGQPSWIILPDFQRFMASLPWKLSDMSEREWRQAVATGWNPLLHEMPVYRQFLRMMAEVGPCEDVDLLKTLRRLDPAWQYHQHRTTTKTVKVCAATYEDLALIFFGTTEQHLRVRALDDRLGMIPSFSTGVLRDRTIDEILGRGRQ